MIAACRKCGKLVEMTEEEAMTPIWSCTASDRLCESCEAERIFTQDALKLLDELKRQKPAPMPQYPRD